MASQNMKKTNSQHCFPTGKDTEAE